MQLHCHKTRNVGSHQKVEAERKNDPLGPLKGM